ncbi:hypothetical protein PR202_gb15273 [Eleusine coracana subsp. coracana]|uniref:Uncharacterized protein n=1 Tax=Eleusine coracana subsp. coracana TaxID=191504 RepID=A0AAV5EXJ3_ELECO|nr:hypothetical protein PR202_gb15273 [Eleusine coracana subsp. coracana]
MLLRLGSVPTLVVSTEEAQKLLVAFFVADYVPWLGWLDTLRGARRRLDRNFRELDAFYERVIDDHLDNNKCSRVSKEEDDLVDVLLRLFSSRSQVYMDVLKHFGFVLHAGHVNCRDGHVCGNGGMNHDGADPSPGRPRQGPGRGPPRRGRRRHGPGTRPPTAPLPEARHQGVPASPPTSATPRPPRDHRAVLHAWPRDSGQDTGARERQGHRAGPRRVGPRRGGVRAGAARGGRGPRRPQAVARRVRARPVRGRAEELSRRALRHGRRRADAGQLAVCLRLACASRWRAGCGGAEWVDGVEKEPSRARSGTAALAVIHFHCRNPARQRQSPNNTRYLYNLLIKVRSFTSCPQS